MGVLKPSLVFFSVGNGEANVRLMLLGHGDILKELRIVLSPSSCKLIFSWPRSSEANCGRSWIMWSKSFLTLSFVWVVVQNVDASCHSLPKGWAAFLQQLGRMGPRKRSSEKGKFWFLQLLDEVELRLGAPPSQIHPQPGDLTVEDVEGSIPFQKVIPRMVRVQGSPDRRKRCGLLGMATRLQLQLMRRTQ